MAASNLKENATVNLIKIVGHTNARVADHDHEIHMMKQSIALLMNQLCHLEVQKEQ